MRQDNFFLFNLVVQRGIVFVTFSVVRQSGLGSSITHLMVVILVSWSL
jgi:hypothetical protein